jgi:alpha-glucosidase (family GH31 glycosyl hydrolase)
VYTLNSFIFSDYLITLDASVFTTKQSEFLGIWGLGERNSNFFYQDGVYTSMDRDAGTPFDNGKPPSDSMYGVHPIYYSKTGDSMFMGVFNLNADPSDWWIKNNKDTGEVRVNYLSVGGVIDNYFILGSTPDEIIMKYH